MNLRLLISLAMAFFLGVIAVKVLPQDWVLRALLFMMGVTLLLGVASSLNTDAEKRNRSPSVPVRVLAYLALGTTQPHAVVRHSSALVAFYCAGACFFGMVVMILLLGDS